MSDNNTRNCPIIERTGDGELCGRCWFYLPDEKTCPRHGDVSDAVATYRAYGELTPAPMTATLRRDRRNDAT